MQDVSQVRKLVQAFRENHKALKDEATPEAVIRQEYIDTLWNLLGWDVRMVMEIAHPRERGDP